MTQAAYSPFASRNVECIRMAPVPGAVDLLARLRGSFEPNVILEASAYVCEDPYKTQRALEGIVPATLLALMNRFSPAALLGLVVNPASSTKPGAIFGEESTRMAEAIASDAGIQKDSVLSLCELAVPRIFEALRQMQSERNLGALALQSVLGAHRGRLARLMPEPVADHLKTWL